MIGIVAYGFYIPKYRIKVSDIAEVWGKNPKDIEGSLNVTEKTVAAIDEDSLTMAYAAAASALEKIKIKKENIGVVFFGSETHPYAVNPASTILAEFLGIDKHYLAYDTEFACKAGTGALISALGLIKSNYSQNALVVAADKAAGRPHDALEYTAASGAVALVVGQKNVALEVVDNETFSTDTPDFWRREGIRFPSHGGRFSGKPSYFYHIQQASQLLFKKTKLKPVDFKYAVFHMPNGKFPIQVALELGFQPEQFNPSLIIPQFGNPYTASALMGLVAVLEKAKENDLIFFCSYGSGAGADAFVFQATKELKNIRQPFAAALKNKSYLNYTQYLKQMEII
jgi:hydroxymethylglutaryl-CoA synthase